MNAEFWQELLRKVADNNGIIATEDLEAAQCPEQESQQLIHEWHEVRDSWATLGEDGEPALAVATTRHFVMLVWQPDRQRYEAFAGHPSDPKLMVLHGPAPEGLTSA